ncbi:MAG: hypothetical protein HZB44_06420 [Actinobacteria bacterium]|nr:hypothetical protein [Actinomycetota bacterium]
MGRICAISGEVHKNQDYGIWFYILKLFVIKPFSFYGFKVKLVIADISNSREVMFVKIATLIVVCMVLTLALTGTALASWPTGAQGDQYVPVNTAMDGVVAGVGISPDTFISIYNAAVAGDVSGYTDSQLAASCEALSQLSGYQDVLMDYNTVYTNLGCSTRLASAGPTRGALPSTGIAIALLIGSGVVGIGAASQMLKRSK